MWICLNSWASQIGLNWSTCLSVPSHLMTSTFIFVSSWSLQSCSSCIICTSPHMEGKQALQICPACCSNLQSLSDCFEAECALQSQLEDTISVGRENSHISGKQVFEGSFGWSKASHTREPSFGAWLDSSQNQAPLVTDEWRIKVATQAHGGGFFGHQRKSSMNQISELNATSLGQKRPVAPRQKRPVSPRDAEQATQLPSRQIKQRMRWLTRISSPGQGQHWYTFLYITWLLGSQAFVLYSSLPNFNRCSAGGFGWWHCTRFCIRSLLSQALHIQPTLVISSWTGWILGTPICMFIRRSRVSQGTCSAIKTRWRHIINPKRTHSVITIRWTHWTLSVSESWLSSLYALLVIASPCTEPAECDSRRLFFWQMQLLLTDAVLQSQIGDYNINWVCCCRYQSQTELSRKSGN